MKKKKLIENQFLPQNLKHPPADYTQMKQFCSLPLYASSPKGISLYHMDNSQYTDSLEVGRSYSVKLSILQLTSIYFKTS